MADKKISQLTSASSIDGSELIAIVKEVNGVKTTLKTTVGKLLGVQFPPNPNEGDTF